MGSEPCFTIVSYNICGLSNPLRIAELRMFLANHKPSVLIILEPKIDHREHITRRGRAIRQTPKKPPTLPGYAHHHAKHPTRNSAIIIYIHTSCTYMVRHEIEPCTPYMHDTSGTTASFVWVSSPLLPHPVVIGGV